MTLLYRDAQTLERMDAGRQARRALTREHVDRVLRLASHLEPRDRELVEATFDRGVPTPALARLCGVPRRRLHRRLREVLGHVSSPEFDFVVRHRHAWPTLRKQVAEIIMLERRSLRDASTETGQSIHAVRREAHAVRVLIEQARAMGRLS